MARDSRSQSFTPGTLRRRGLLRAGVAAMLLPQASLVRAAGRSDVIVLGAGLSGLYSAMLLEDLGYKVQVLEASEEVGGRVRTRRFGGIQYDMGASEVGTLYGRVRQTIARMGLNLKAFGIGIDPFSYHVGGKLVAAADWESAAVNRTVGAERAIEPALLESQTIRRLNPFKATDEWLKPEHLPMDVSLASYLRSHGVSQAAVDLIGQTIQGSDINRTSALTMFRDATRVRAGFEAWRSRPEDQRDPAHYQQVEGGTHRLPEAMAANLASEVHLRKAAVVVEQDKVGVTVTCQDGSRYQADRLITTMSLPAMRNVEFRPGLSAAKAAAIRAAQYYETTKFYLRPTQPFWDQDGFTASLFSDGFLERVFAVTDGGGEVHTLLVWINGAGTRMIDAMDPAAAGQMVLQELARIRPASKGKLEIVGHYSWGRDPYTGGCGYSYGAGEVGAYAQQLPLPEGRIYFAGEHTRRVEAGMESAMASSERAVSELAMADTF